MTALLIGDAERTLIKSLVEKATAEPVPYEKMAAMHAAYAEGKIANGMNDFGQTTVTIPMGFRVTYTHEFHKPDVCCRHLSVSVDKEGRAPNQYTMAMLMQEFGFKNPWPVVVISTEQLKDGRVAISVIEPLDGDLTKIMAGDMSDDEKRAAIERLRAQAVKVPI